MATDCCIVLGTFAKTGVQGVAPKASAKVDASNTLQEWLLFCLLLSDNGLADVVKSRTSCLLKSWPTCHLACSTRCCRPESCANISDRISVAIQPVSFNEDVLVRVIKRRYVLYVLHRYKCFLLYRKLLIAARSQFTCRTRAATSAPVMQHAAFTQITGVGVSAY